MHNFRKYVEENSTIGSNDLVLLEKLAASRRLKKGEMLIREGERCDKEIFVEEGVVRAFLVDEEGNEKSTAFFQEGEFISIVSRRTKQHLSLYHYQAICQTTVLLFDPKALIEHLSRAKQLQAIGAGRPWQQEPMNAKKG